jgi:hypothetical protein
MSRDSQTHVNGQPDTSTQRIANARVSLKRWGAASFASRTSARLAANTGARAMDSNDRNDDAPNARREWRGRCRAESR